MKVTNQHFRRIFVFLMSLSMALAAILLMHLLLLIPIDSSEMWIGTGIMVFGLNLFFSCKKVRWRIITLVITALSMMLFLINMLQWQFDSSLYFAAITTSLFVLLYMTFV